MFPLKRTLVCETLGRAAANSNGAQRVSGDTEPEGGIREGVVGVYCERRSRERISPGENEFRSGSIPGRGLYGRRTKREAFNRLLVFHAKIFSSVKIAFHIDGSVTLLSVRQMSTLMTGIRNCIAPIDKLERSASIIWLEFHNIQTAR